MKTELSKNKLSIKKCPICNCKLPAHKLSCPAVSIVVFLPPCSAHELENQKEENMTKPGFTLDRIKQLFESDDIVAQQEIVDKYNIYRDLKSNDDGNYCYCGHTNRCECSNPGISEFKSGLFTGSITEELLNKIL